MDLVARPLHDQKERGMQDFRAVNIGLADPVKEAFRHRSSFRYLCGAVCVKLNLLLVVLKHE